MKSNENRNHMKTIINLMEEKGITELHFIFHKNKPTVQKDGIKYEIISIYLEDVDGIEEKLIFLDGIKVYPCYEYKLIPLLVDNTWRKTSINHIENIVKQEINNFYQ